MSQVEHARLLLKKPATRNNLAGGRRVALIIEGYRVKSSPLLRPNNFVQEYAAKY